MSYVGNTNTTQAFTPAIDYFSGNGSTVAFTLSRPVASVAQVQVVVNNVAQNPTDAYTILNNTITFTGAPSSGTNNIYVYYTSPITQVIQPGQGTVGTAQIQNGAVIPADLSTGGPYWDASGNVGIGTTSPVTKMQLGGSTNKAIRIDTALSNAAFYAGWQDAALLGVNRNPENGIFTNTGKSSASIGIFGENGNSYITFATASANNTGDVERARINSTGTLVLNQGQIQFPATQVPSANANTLDDYEEGGWTPTSLNGAVTVTNVYVATYVKIGRFVLAYNYIGVSVSSTTTGIWGGLPFPCTGYGPATRYYSSGATTFSNNCYVENGATYVLDGGTLPAGTYGIMISAYYMTTA